MLFALSAVVLAFLYQAIQSLFTTARQQLAHNWRGPLAPVVTLHTHTATLVTKRFHMYVPQLRSRAVSSRR